MATKSTNASVKIAPINAAFSYLEIVGDTPLLVNRYSDENKSNRIKDREQEFENKLHIIESNGNGTVYGFPGSGIKKACVTTCNTHVKGLYKTVLQGGFFITAYLVPIVSPKPPIPFTTVVITTQGKAVEVTRPMFEDWKMSIPVKFLPTVVSLADITNILNWAGTTVGIGSWRPFTNGIYGTFHVEAELVGKE